MNISPVSFKENLITRINKQNIPKEFVDPPEGFKIPPSDMIFKTNDKKQNQKKQIATAGGLAGLVVLALAIIKRKSITKFVKKYSTKPNNHQAG